MKETNKYRYFARLVRPDASTEALTRGRVYEVFSVDARSRKVKIRLRGKTGEFHSTAFDYAGMEEV